MSRVPSFDLNGGTEELDKVSLKLISSKVSSVDTLVLVLVFVMVLLESDLEAHGDAHPASDAQTRHSSRNSETTHGVDQGDQNPATTCS